MLFYSLLETTLCCFIAFLRLEGLHHQTAKSYLSAVHHLQMSQGLGDHRFSTMPQLELVLQGMKRELAGQPAKPRLPITLAILRRICGRWNHSKEWDHIMLWAAMCLCFLASYVQVKQWLQTKQSSILPSIKHAYANIAVDSVSKPTYLQINIKQSKTDPFRLGIKVIVGRTRNELCPVAAVLSYMALRGPGSGPLFRFKNGKPLTRSSFVAKLRETLEVAGVDCSGYSSHSFRIGAATTAASRGIQDSLIKTMGRWQSIAYQLYVSWCIRGEGSRSPLNLGCNWLGYLWNLGNCVLGWFFWYQS